jgi:SAM-dependent methyltransferase
MHDLSPTDPGLTIDWGKASGDYAQFRPGPPPSFYERLRVLGVGLPGQRILDLGTGTGVIARQLAQQGAQVVGVDISEEQIAAARALARSEGVDVEFHVAPAEATTLSERSFNIVTASQCWLYFDAPRAVAEVRRVLRAGGLLVTSHLSWLPRLDPVAHASEALVLEHNPRWTAGDFSGEVPPVPRWARGSGLRLRAMFWYDEPVGFTRESWRGRIRACRGIGATLDAAAVARFDEAHGRLLDRMVPERFTVLHRIDAHIFEVSPATAG